MAHFARVEDNVVREVIVVNNAVLEDKEFQNLSLSVLLSVNHCMEKALSGYRLVITGRFAQIMLGKA